MGTETSHGDLKKMIDKNYQEAVKDIKKTLTVLENNPDSGLVVKETKHPNAVWHLRISLAKSLIRIVAGCALVMGELVVAGGLLILAEILGIGEELV
jgi:hypothetical protein